jgi:protein TonB
MSDNTIEKPLLYLVALSLTLHAGAFALLHYLPEARPPKPKEPVFVDLQNLPELHAQQKPRLQKTTRLSDRQVRVKQELTTRELDTRISSAVTPSASQKNQVYQQAKQRTSFSSPQEQNSAKGRTVSLPAEHYESPDAPVFSSSELLKPHISSGKQASQPQIFPSAGRLTKLEESYRRKYEKDIADGDTQFLNSDDILFGSFLRRFETAIYGVWHYPQEAAMKGIEGITPVRITFNRRGEILNVKLLESSGAKILDDEVFRTVKMIGPVGAFPKGFNKDEFHLIAFFQYGGSQKSLR